ncbi:MAG: prepilin-type N-terminal cleavage/methylation domain-containing protein [Conexivisphaerales archaeon]
MDNRGFTLIELLVVASIVVMLVGFSLGVNMILTRDAKINYLTVLAPLYHIEMQKALFMGPDSQWNTYNLKYQYLYPLMNTPFYQGQKTFNPNDRIFDAIKNSGWYYVSDSNIIANANDKSKAVLAIKPYSSVWQKFNSSFNVPSSSIYYYAYNYSPLPNSVMQNIMSFFGKQEPYLLTNSYPFSFQNINNQGKVSIIGPTSLVYVPNLQASYVCLPTFGTPPYTFNWSIDKGTVTANQDQAIISFPAPDTYNISVVVVDKNNVSMGAKLTVEVYSQLTASIVGPSEIYSSLPVSRDYTVSVNGGVPPYTYQWSNNNTSSTSTYTFQNSGTFTISVTVIDSRGVSVNVSKDVAVYSVLSASITGPNQIMTNTAKTYTVSASGGKPPYTYTWSNGNQGVSTQYSWSTPGNYTISVTVKDSNNNQTTAQLNVQVYGTLTVTIAGPTAGIVNKSYSFQANISGGMSPYQISWSQSYLISGNGNTSAVYQFSSPGTYNISVSVTDSLGNTASNVQSITIYNALVAQVTGPTSGSTNTQYTFTVTASGGLSPYTYSWSTDGFVSQTGNTAVYKWTSGGTKTVTVTVTDSLGNAVSASISVQISATGMTVSISGANTIQPGTASVYIATVSGGASPYTYTWSKSGPFAPYVTLSSVPSYPYQVTVSTGTTTPTGTFNLTVTVTDATGAQASATITITIGGVSS